MSGKSKKTKASNDVCSVTQVNITFLPEQDRLVFAMNTGDNQQFRFYFTRRWVKLFWANLTRILQDETPAAGYDTQARDAAVAFQHEATMSDADYETPFQTEGFTYPWGEEPLIATEIRFHEPPMGEASIGIYAANGIGLEFNSGHKILHYLYQILPEATNKADWDLNLTGFDANKIGFSGSTKLN